MKYEEIPDLAKYLPEEVETAEEISVTKQGRCIIKPLRITKKGIK